MLYKKNRISTTKKQLEDMLITTLFEVKGIMEGEDVLEDDDNKGKSVLWRVLRDRMEVLKGRHKHYKFIVDEMKGIDEFFDEIGIDGFK